MVAYAVTQRRARFPDGTLQHLSGPRRAASPGARLGILQALRAGGSPVLTTTALQGLTGVSGAVQPVEFAAVSLVSTGHPGWSGYAAGYTDAPRTDVAGTVWQGDLDRTSVAVADVDVCEDPTALTAVVDADLTGDDPFVLVTAPGATTFSAQPLSQALVHNARAQDPVAENVTAWEVVPAAAGTWDRPASTLTAADGTARAAHRVTATSGALAAGTVLRPAQTSTACWSLVPGRQLTVAGWPGAAGGTGRAHYRVTLVDVAGATTTLDGPTFDVAVGAGTRIASTLAITTSIDVRSARVALVVDAGSAATALTWWTPQLYAGADRRGEGGLDVAGYPLGGLTFVVTPPATSVQGGRLLNRVDVYPLTDVGGITAASAAKILTAGAGSSTTVGWGEDDGAVTVVWDGNAAGQGDRYAVRVEEMRTGTGRQWAVLEVEGSFTLDLDVASIDVERAAEADPGDGSLPFGNFTAGSISVVAADSSDAGANSLSPARNPLVDTAHRIEAAVGVAYPTGETVPGVGALAGQTGVVEVVEAVPLGVFYSTGWDADSGTRKATITGTDVLGYRGPTAIDATPSGPGSADELVAGTWAGVSIEAELYRLAQVGFGLTPLLCDIRVPAYMLRWPYPKSTAGPYLAELATAARSTAYADGLGRLVVRTLDSVDAAATVALSDDVALIGARYPLSPDRVRNTVQVTGSPLAWLGLPPSTGATDPGTAAGRTWVLGDGVGAGERIAGGTALEQSSGGVTSPTPWVPADRDLRIAVGASLDVLVDWKTAHDFTLDSPTVPNSTTSRKILDAPQDIAAAWAAYLDTATLVVRRASATALSQNTPGDVTATARLYSTWGVLTFVNVGPEPVYVCRANVRGYPLRELALVGTARSAASVTRYGARQLNADVRLAQTSAQLRDVAAMQLDVWKGIEEDGTRRLPDITVETLGLPHLDPLSAAQVASTVTGVSGTFGILGHRLSWAATATSSLTLRRAPVLGS